VRWHYLGAHKAAFAVAPSPKQTEPDPPSADEAARLLKEKQTKPASSTRSPSTRTQSSCSQSIAICGHNGAPLWATNTELVAAGVDIRTVAGRLGHGSGGTTTLKVYAGRVDEAHRRAAETMAAVLPTRCPRHHARRRPFRHRRVRGYRRVQMPNVEGQGLAAAKAALLARGLKVANQTQEICDAAKNTVLDQMPDAGAVGINARL
jgi:PASTA domain